MEVARVLLQPCEPPLVASMVKNKLASSSSSAPLQLVQSFHGVSVAVNDVDDIEAVHVKSVVCWCTPACSYLSYLLDESLLLVLLAFCSFSIFPFDELALDEHETLIGTAARCSNWPSSFATSSKTTKPVPSRSGWIYQSTAPAGAAKKLAGCRPCDAAVARVNHTRSPTLTGVRTRFASNLRYTTADRCREGGWHGSRLCLGSQLLLKCAPCSVGPRAPLETQRDLASKLKVVVEPTFKNIPGLVRFRASHLTRQTLQPKWGQKGLRWKLGN